MTGTASFSTYGVYGPAPDLLLKFKDDISDICTAGGT